MGISQNSTEVINISVFGPSDHGKSTLVGFLFAHFRQQEFQKIVRNLQRRGQYQADRKYACVSDRHPSEQIGKLEQIPKPKIINKLELVLKSDRFASLELISRSDLIEAVGPVAKTEQNIISAIFGKSEQIPATSHNL